MVQVVFASVMEQYTNGEKQIQLEASNYRQLCGLLVKQFPLLNGEILSKFAVAIDDEVINDPLLEALNKSSELFFVPKIVAG